MDRIIREIDGDLFEQMILGGVANLQANLQTVNDLNVFPIPDGDTGENMYLTLKGGLDGLKKTSGSLYEKAHAMASGMLLGARGNSGVILSQLFYGLSEGLFNMQTASIEVFGKALKNGVKCAYGAVAHPVEGTILTVAREAVENACLRIEADTTVQTFFKIYLSEMQKSLEKTPNLLAVLKESGVIDSGGAGLVYITEGFCRALGGERIESELSVSADSKNTTLDFSKFNEDSEMVYGYCTELLLQLQKSKTDVENFSVDDLIAYLNQIGDSIVAFKTGTIVKIHVHTLTPWKVLAYCQQFGEYLTVKIENMTLQHNEVVEKNEGVKFKKVKTSRKKYAVVAVVSGKGLIQVFKDLGANYVIEGGQTNNPSTEDFIEAFDEVNADYIFVLPNNSNILLAAKQAAEMYKDSDVRVIQSKSIGAGYSALSTMDVEADDPNTIEELLNEDCKSAITGYVSIAVRSTQVNGIEIKKGEYIGFSDKTMLVSTPEKAKTVCDLVQKMHVEEKQFLIAAYGKSVTDEERGILAKEMLKYPQTEFYEIEGEQEVYDFLLIVE